MNKFKLIGLVAAGAGFLLSLIGNWASEKQQEKEMDEKLDKKLDERGYPKLT